MNNNKKIFSSTRIPEAISSRPFIRENGEVEGDPRIIRDLGVESWDELPLDISAASSTASSVQQTATSASGFTKDADKTAPKAAPKTASSVAISRQPAAAPG